MVETTTPAAEPIEEVRKPEPRKHKEYLRYDFTDAEKLVNAGNLGRQVQELRSLERRKAEVTADLSSQVKHKSGVVDEITTLVTNGYIYRDVDCEVHMDTPGYGMKTVIRLDTGENVSVERMTESERQMVLNFYERLEEKDKAAAEANQGSLHLVPEPEPAPAEPQTSHPKI